MLDFVAGHLLKEFRYRSLSIGSYIPGYKSRGAVSAVKGVAVWFIPGCILNNFVLQGRRREPRWLVWLQSFFYFVARKVQLHSPPSVVSTIKHTVIASYRRPNIVFSIQICYIMKHRCCLTANALTRQMVVHSKRKKFLLYSYTIVLSCKVSSI